MLPKRTAETELKPLPLRYTTVPPVAGPEDCETLVMIGAERKEKASSLVAVPPPVVTETSTVPALRAGLTAVIEDDELTVTEAAALPPNVTVAPLLKFTPVIVTVVPPDVGPAAGETEEIDGTAM